MPKITKEITNYSPLDPIHTVLLGGPGTEAVMGLTMPPEISLFEPADPNEVSSVVAARQDHDRMIEELSKHGIEVFNMRQVIGEVLAEHANHRFTSADLLLKELRKRAFALHQKYGIEVPFEHILIELEMLLRQDIDEMGLDPAIAINGVLTNIIGIDGNEKPFDPTLGPAGNFMYWRDTNHVTGKEVGTHRMFYPIRDQEVALAQLGFDSLGIKYREVFANGTKGNIEGGDILPMEFGGERFALIGTAERTSWAAVEAWFKLHEASFSASGDGLIPGVVEGPNHDTQDEMHLDTFSQQIAAGAVIHCGEITSQRDFSLLMRKGGEIVRVKPEDAFDGTYREWLESKADHVHNMSKQDQLNYAPNVLVNGDGEGGTTVFITRDGTPEVTEFIRQHAIEIIELKMNHLTKFYGGAHCATTEFRSK